MSEERRIPVLINGDHSNVVGWLILSDKISDQEVFDCYISWGAMGNEKLMDMSLIPIPRLRIKIENDPPGPIDRCAYCGNPVSMTAKEAKCGFVSVHRLDAATASTEQAMPPDDRDRRVD